MKKTDFFSSIIEELHESEMVYLSGGNVPDSLEKANPNNGNGTCSGTNNQGGLCNGPNNHDGRCSGVNNGAGYCGTPPELN